MTKKPNIPVIIVEEENILSIRGHKVMLDKALAELYGVRPIALRQQVKRNIEDFARRNQITQIFLARPPDRRGFNRC